jgi:cytochrome P450
MNASNAIDEPDDPISAVTHPDPYGYYARLVAERPLYRDEALGLWVASSAAAVTAVLSSPVCRVRPVSEPVPKSLGDSAAATIFGRLVRMNDGAAHQSLKPAVAATFDALNAEFVASESTRWAAILARQIGCGTEPSHLADFAFHLSAHVLGSLLGVTTEALPLVTPQVAALVRGLVPGCSSERIEHGNGAALKLQERFRTLHRNANPADETTLFAELSRQAQRFGCDDPDTVVANGIGFLTQAHEATAGLINQSMLTLANRPDIRDQIDRTPALLAAVVDEVLRFDSPVQNTRRFVSEPTTIEGAEFRSGDVVLVVLAAANRDSAANPQPDRFDATRHDRRVFSFGVGPHACPGRRVAVTIATAGVARLLENGVMPAQLETHPVYRPSANTRIPLLCWRNSTPKLTLPNGEEER